jgi:hypothetical protein
MAGAKRARTAETPKPPSLCLRLHASYFYSDYLNLDGGFDSRSNRKVIFNAEMIPNINENLRHRKTTQRGRKRLFNRAIRR